jgi:CelD/BcsL family acetyltransferase involved in cellulose biosynthesis
LNRSLDVGVDAAYNPERFLKRGNLMPLQLAQGKEAAKMLSSPDFRSQWLQLYDECPWATAVQSPGFAASWYEAYKEQYSSVLVCEFSGTNALTGLLAVAVNRSGQAIIPGGRQAEYKSWLALPPNGSPFIASALALLSQEMKIGALQFRYLPYGAPVDGMCASTGAPWTCEVETHPRPIVRLRSAAEVTDYQRQKTNKSIKNKWNRLKRLGHLRLERILECGELIPIFDQLIDWYDTRQELAHGRRPFQIDKNKKEWHLRLLKEGLLHVTLLKAGQELISALFGLSDGKTYSVMMPVFAPAYAQYSPIAVHHLMLVRLLHEEGYSVLDLTPGPDEFKDRFAGAYDSVQALSIYFTQREWIKAKVRQRTRNFAKRLLAMFGIEPTSFVRNLPRIQALLRLKRPAKVPTIQRA